jgi:hypothetical protein
MSGGKLRIGRHGLRRFADCLERWMSLRAR